MKQIVKLTEESSSLFESGTVVDLNGETYFYYPFWLKKTENSLEYEVIYFDKLPAELKEYIKDIRENPPQTEWINMNPKNDKIKWFEHKTNDSE